MKKSLMALLCVAYFAIATPLWVRDDSMTTTTNRYRGLCVIDSSKVWIVGENGLAWKRRGGVHSHSWKDMSDSLPDRHQYYHLNDVCFVDTSTGWIVGQCKYDTTVNDTVYKKYQGIIYRTINGGSSWSIQTPPGFDDPPTPFLKAQFASGSYGYVTCGNGIVIKTEDGGQTWEKTTSDPWNDNNNESVWYGGLKVVDASNLWVAGDAFGILSKSTNGGNSWTSYQPSGFAQSYTFPQGATAPYGTRLANFDVDLTSMSNMRVGLSYGKVGVTTNGGTSWSVESWESQPVWFRDVAVDTSSDFHGVGNYRVVNQEGNHKHNVWDEKHNQMFNNASFYSVDVSQNNIGYATGQEYSVPLWYCPTVIQRYEPVGFVFDTVYVVNSDSIIIVKWHTTFENNTDYWKVGHERMTPLYHGYSPHPNVDAAGFCTTTTSYECTLDVHIADCRYHYISLLLYTNDPQYNPPYFLMYGPREESLTWIADTSRLDTVSTFTVADRANDQGGALALTWNKVDNATTYRIGRSEYATGPFWLAHTASGPTDTTWIDTLALQNGKSYYYIAQACDGWARHFSWPSNTISGVPADDSTPAPPSFITSGCYLDTSHNHIRLEWNAVSNTPDVAGYWVCPIPPGESDYNLSHASPIDRTIYYMPVDSAWQGWCIFYVAAMDYSGNISNWGGPCSIYVNTNIDTSSSDKATAYNNGRKMVRYEDTIWVCYESGGTVYVKKSTDNGSTWSSRMQIGSGYQPCIGINVDSEQEIALLGVAWWAQGTNDTIYFSKHNSGTSWSTPAAIATSSNDLGSPSIVIDDDDYCYLTYPDNTTIKYTRFDIDKCNPHTPDSVGQGSSPSIGQMVNALGYPEVHVAWESSSSVKYRSKTLSSGWNSTENLLTNGKRPFLEVVGAAVHVVCDSSGEEIWHSKTVYSEGGHSWTSTEVSNTTDNSKYATITGGNAIAWVEELRDNKEIYYSTYDAKDGWSDEANISETSNNSNYAHIAEKQTGSSTKLFFVWTENNSAPYDIMFRWQILTDEGEASDADLPFYVAECGEEQPSGFTVERDGYIHYGRESYKRIDYGSPYLEYQFEMLNPERDYALAVFAYHENTSATPITIHIDNQQIGAVSVPSSQLLVHKEMIPLALLEDSTLQLKVNGNNAISAIIALYEYEHESTKGTSGPQAYDEKQFAGKLMLQMPNPVVRRTLMKYEIPIGEAAKIKIYDITGALRREIVLPSKHTGQVLWDVKDNIGRKLAMGVYFCRLETADRSITEKVVFLR
jgi:hypothetical protein